MPAILIVEDEPIQAMKLEAILAAEQYRVRVAGNGAEALALMRIDAPDLVVSDIVMPTMDGYELCRAIRKDEQLCRTGVILLTSLSEPTDVIKGLQAGADNFVTKPYDTPDLLHIVRESCRGQEARAGAGTPEENIGIRFQDQEYAIGSSRLQILNFFLSAYRSAIEKNDALARAQKDLRYLNENLARLVDERTAALKQEVASRKKAEEESRDRAALLDKAQDAILVLDLEGVVEYCNKSAEHLYGWDAASILGKDSCRLFYDERRRPPREPMEIVKRNGEWMGEMQQVTRSGQEIIVQSSWTLVHDDVGRPRSILSINTNVTEKKKLEAQFLRTQRLESIGALAGGIAHDLNNLIAPILLAIGVLRRKVTDEQLLKTLALMDSGARRAVDIVKQVLTFARGSGDERVLLQPVHLMKEVLDIVRQSFPRSIELAHDYPQDLKLVSGDPTQLHQVLMNLCVNARDAMPQGGTLSLTMENVFIDPAYVAMNPEAKPGPYMLIRVRDTGSGIPQEIKDKIYEPFFTTKEPGKGTGLGLSTVLSIVHGHGGFIDLESEPGRGTEFRVYLPAVSGGVEEAPGAGRTAAAPGQGELILCVDDEEIVREMTKLTLEGFGYRVVTACDGTEALTTYVTHQKEISAMVIDLAMPYLDGTALIRALLRLNPDAKIIAISGHDDAARKAKSLFEDRIPFIRKPFTIDRLLGAIRTVIEDVPEEEEEASPDLSRDREESRSENAEQWTSPIRCSSAAGCWCTVP